MLKNQRIAVIGGGITGACLSLLVGKEINVTLFEQYSRHKRVKPTPTVLLQPPALNVLDRLNTNVLNDVISMGSKVHKVFGRCTYNRIPLIDLDLKRLHPSYFALGVNSDHLRHRLLDEIDTYERIETRYDAKVDGVVTHFTKDNKLGLICKGDRLDEAYDSVILATGIDSIPPQINHSRMYYESAVIKPMKFACKWVNIRKTRDNEDNPVWKIIYEEQTVHTVFGGSKVMITIIPCSNDICTFYWSESVRTITNHRPFDEFCGDATSTTAPLDISSILRLLEPYYDQMYIAYSNRRIMDYFHVDGANIAFCGDMAHTNSRLFDQRINLALLDASEAASSMLSNNTFRSYTIERYEQSMYYQMLSNVFTPIWQSNGSIYAWFRDGMMWPLANVSKIFYNHCARTFACLKIRIRESMDEGKIKETFDRLSATAENNNK